VGAGCKAKLQELHSAVLGISIANTGLGSADDRGLVFRA